MSEIDLKLVPIESLINELQDRCVTFCACIQTYQDRDKNDKITWYQFGKGTWQDSIAVAAILQNMIMNDWTGELETLKRIHNDGIY